MIHSSAHPLIKRCPVCGVSMVGSRTKPSYPELDLFECLNCGLAINHSESNRLELPSGTTTIGPSSSDRQMLAFRGAGDGPIDDCSCCMTMRSASTPVDQPTGCLTRRSAPSPGRYMMTQSGKTGPTSASSRSSRDALWHRGGLPSRFASVSTAGAKQVTNQVCPAAVCQTGTRRLTP
jgi:hypothetical protein